jgi:hypothetical protein
VELITSLEDKRLTHAIEFSNWKILEDSLRAALARLAEKNHELRLIAGAVGEFYGAKEEGKTILEKIKFLRDLLAEKEGQVCALVEAARKYMAMIEHPETHIILVGGPDPVKMVNDLLAALSSSSPCPHAKEVERLGEVVEVLCRETLGAIIDATTMVQVEKLSGNVVKEEYAKGELHSLRLLESWFDRHVPESMAELRRRAGGE